MARFDTLDILLSPENRTLLRRALAAFVRDTDHVDAEQRATVPALDAILAAGGGQRRTLTNDQYYLSWESLTSLNREDSSDVTVLLRHLHDIKVHPHLRGFPPAFYRWLCAGFCNAKVQDLEYCMCFLDAIP